MMITAPKLALQLGITTRSVTRWCTQIGIKKTGRDYILDEKQVAMIRTLYRPARGRPFSD